MTEYQQKQRTNTVQGMSVLPMPPPGSSFPYYRRGFWERKKARGSRSLALALLSAVCVTIIEELNTEEGS